MSIKFADVAEEREGGVSWNVRGVSWLGYLVHSLGNRAMTLPTETGLRSFKCKCIGNRKITST